MPSPSTESPDTPSDAGDENDSRITITRRDALIGAVTAGILNALGVGATGVAVAESGIDLQTSYANGDAIYEQYAAGDLEAFTLGGGTEVSLDYPPMNDDYIVGEVALSYDGSSYETFGQAQESSLDNENGGTVTFGATTGGDSGNGFWGGTAGEMADGSFDFHELDMFDSDGDGIFENLSVDEPTASGDPLANDSSFDLRFRFVSSEGTLTEEEIVSFTMSIGVPLGFGQYFGVNFGRNHVERWPTDWDA